jgi:hypothetical protein
VSLRRATDAGPADWIVSGLRGFAASVLSLVPEGFSAYVRVFHPAYRAAGVGWTPVRWHEIAAANGKRAHAGMQLCALTGSHHFMNHPQPGVFDRPPRDGSLPPELAAHLATALAAHTATPDRCWFAVWNGFGGTPSHVRAAPTFRVPHREYHLLEGPVPAAAESFLEAPAMQLPNLWWPDDRAWCVASEIDLNTTYIGCDQATSDEIFALRDVEALAIDPATGVTDHSDLLNPFK